MLDKFSQLIDLIKSIEDRLGIRKLIEYTLYFLILAFITNWKDVLYNVETILNGKMEVRHSELLEKREKLEKNVSDILTDLRVSIYADRIILFEYHNTVSNFAGIPFRFMTMTQVNLGYRIPPLDSDKYSSINTGLISEFTKDLDRNGYIEVRDFDSFKSVYPTMSKLIASDSIKNAAFVHLNGTTKPLGFLLIEWTNDDYHPNWMDVRNESQKVSQKINALILSIKQQ